MYILFYLSILIHFFYHNKFIFIYPIKLNYFALSQYILFFLAQAAESVEYTDCISAEG